MLYANPSFDSDIFFVFVTVYSWRTERNTGYSFDSLQWKFNFENVSNTALEADTCTSESCLMFFYYWSLLDYKMTLEPLISCVFTKRWLSIKYSIIVRFFSSELRVHIFTDPDSCHDWLFFRKSKQIYTPNDVNSAQFCLYSR